MQGDDTRNNENNETVSERTTDAARADVSLSLDAVLSLLAHHQRRDLLHFVNESPNHSAALDECVGYLMRREEERNGERPGHDQVEAVLHHVHIPKLTDAGVLDYDPRSQMIRYWGHDQLEDWLAQIGAYESELD